MSNGFEIIDGYPRIDKDPNAVLDYTVDWSDWLGVGETILVVTPSAKGVTVDSSGIVGGTAVTLWLSGGRAGSLAKVTLHISTSSSPARTDDRTIYFRLLNR